MSIEVGSWKKETKRTETTTQEKCLCHTKKQDFAYSVGFEEKLEG